MTLPLTELLLAQRADRKLIDALPEAFIPADVQTAYRVQNETVSALGPVGAWKVQPYPETGEPFAAPIPLVTVFADNAVLDAQQFPITDIEAEVAVTLNRDLPQRDTPYEISDVAATIGSVHLAIELLSSRFSAASKLPHLVGIADLQNNAAVVVGPARKATDLSELGQQAMTLSVDGAEIGKVSGGSTTQTVLASLAWLANHAAARELALKQGDVIITGARIGALPLRGKKIVVEADGFAAVSVSIE